MDECCRTFIVNFRDSTDGICVVRRFEAKSVDEAYAKAEEYRRTMMISPDDMEIWTIADENGNDLWTAY